MMTSNAKTPLSPAGFHYTKTYIHMYVWLQPQKRRKKKRSSTRRKSVHNMSSGHEVMIFIYGWVN